MPRRKLIWICSADNQRKEEGFPTGMDTAGESRNCPVCNSPMRLASDSLPLGKVVESELAKDESATDIPTQEPAAVVVGPLNLPQELPQSDGLTEVL